jgi:hypothetical protein
MFMCWKEEAFLAGCEDQEAKERSGTLPRAIPIRTPTIRSRPTQSKRRLVDFRPTRQTIGPSRDSPRSTKPALHEAPFFAHIHIHSLSFLVFGR